MEMVRNLRTLPISLLWGGVAEGICRHLFPKDQKWSLLGPALHREWKQRFDVQDLTSRGQPTTYPHVPGWYSLTSRYVRWFIESAAAATLDIPAGVGLERVKRVVDDWIERISEGQNRNRDDVPVLVHFVEHPESAAQLQIDQIGSTGPRGKELFLQPVDINRWILTDGGDLFQIPISGPGTLPFERAARVIERQMEFGCDESPLLLEWIFAPGEHNALEIAEACLSHRAIGKGRGRISYTAARQCVRCALGY